MADLAALNIEIGADLTKLQQGLNTANTYVDQFAKDIANVASKGAAANGGMQAFAKSVDNVTSALKNTSSGFDAVEKSINEIASQFFAKWNPIVDEAAKLSAPLQEAALKAKQLQTQLNSFGGGVLQFKSSGLDLIIKDSKLLIDTVNGIPTNKVIGFTLSSSTQQVLTELNSLSAEIYDLGNGGSVSIGKINTALAQLRTASSTATNVESLQQYDRAIKLLEKDLNQVVDVSKRAGVSMSTIKGASNAGTLAIGNFGRVLQDLPYGFIGISNNLNPLLESFQRLRAEAKVTGTSVLPLLTKSLVGGGGLGLAVSAVTAIMGFASIGLSFWTRGLGNNKKAIEDNKKVIDEYVQALNRSYEAAGQQLAQVSIRVAAIQKENTSLEERKKIVEQLKQTNDTYFSDLKIENGLVIGLTQAYDLYAANILKVARAKAAQETVQKLSTELVKTSDAVNGIDVNLTNLNLTFAQAAKLLGGQTTGNAFDDIAKASQKVNDIVDSGLPTFEQLKLLSEVTGISEQELNKTLAQRQLLKTKELSLTTQISSLSAFIAENDTNSYYTTEAKTKQIDRVAQALLELQNRLHVIDLSEGGDPVKKYDAIYSTVKKLLDLKVPENGTIIQKLIGDANQLYIDNLATFTNKFGEAINKGVKDVKAPYVPIKINIDPVTTFSEFQTILKKRFLENTGKLFTNSQGIKVPVKLLNDYEVDYNYEQLKNYAEGFANIVANTFTNALTGLGDSIGEFIASGFENTNVFGGIFEVLGNGLKELGKYVIESTTIIASIKKAINAAISTPAGAVLGIAAGIALEALGSILLSKAPKLAGGGIIPPGFEGDRFPAFLNSGEAVIPLDKLNQYINTDGSTQVVIPEVVLKGSDLVIAFNRQQRKNNRVY